MTVTARHGREGKVNVKVLYQDCHSGRCGLGSFGLSFTGTPEKGIECLPEFLA